MTSTVDRPVLVGLQYLRALAATAVVAFHAVQRAGGHFIIGEAGVDLFFVLSGFLMIAITSPKTEPLAFARDRLMRIVPPYWIATSVFLVIGLLGFFPNLTLDWRHVAASYLFVAYPSPDAAQAWPLLVPGWTLNYEMFFYALFTIALFMPRRAQPALLATVLAALVLAGLIGSDKGLVSAFYTDPILLEFGAGVILGAAWKRWGGVSPAIGWVLLALGALGLLAAALQNTDHGRALLFGLPALLLLAGVLCIEHRPGGIPKIPGALLLGNASYSIYLWHTMALSVVFKVCSRLGVSGIGLIAVGILGGLAVGIAAHLLIEKPLQTYFKLLRTRHKVPIPAGV